jgi:hypothetical protein
MQEAPEWNLDMVIDGLPVAPYHPSSALAAATLAYRSGATIIGLVGVDCEGYDEGKLAEHARAFATLHIALARRGVKLCDLSPGRRLGLPGPTVLHP